MITVLNVNLEGCDTAERDRIIKKLTSDAFLDLIRHDRPRILKILVDDELVYSECIAPYANKN